jgi:Domain of unknown function (DUF4260)
MSNAVTGGLRVILRLEGFCVLATSLLVYERLGMGWGVFAVFFLAPDLAMLGYVIGPRTGAVSYNFSHSYIGALMTIALGVDLSAPVATAAGLIWIAHVGFDRALGYGLKYSSGFRSTHLGLIGRSNRAV